MKNYHYNYIITNLNNYKRYIGVRSCNCWPTEDNKYTGSCKTLKKIMVKEGKEWFKKEIIALWDIRELAVEHEIRLHNYFEVGMNPMFYNQSKQTSTRWDTTGVKLSGETRKKLSEIHKGKKISEETKRKISKSEKGKKTSEETKRKMSKSASGKNNPMYGKKHTEKTKNKMSLSRQGKNAPWYGKKLTKEARRKLSLANLGKNNPNYGKRRKQKRIQCPHCDKIGGVVNMKRYHMDNCKYNPNKK